DLGHGGQAVRGAGSVGDDVVLGGVVLLVVHAHHDRDVLVLGGGGDDDLLRARLQVGLGLLGFGEEAGGLHHVIGAQRLPRQLRGTLDGQDLDGAAGDVDGVA